MISEIKQIRLNQNLTQDQLSTLLNIPIRTLQHWEQNKRKPNKWVTTLVIDKILSLNYQNEISESSGILSYADIVKKVTEVANTYDIQKVYLFGSYVKGQANKFSDVDLYMETSIQGLAHYAVAEDFRNALNKKVDLLSEHMIIKNSKIDQEIKNTGVLVYER